jgi:hypothetical protein
MHNKIEKYKRIKKKIEQSLKAIGDYDDNQIKDIAFHMVDWIGELDALAGLFENPEEYEAKEVERIIIGFLVHVPNHIAAASKLMIDQSVSDIFGVGAVEIGSNDENTRQESDPC